MTKRAFRERSAEPPGYPELDQGRRACLLRLGAGAAILLALDRAAHASEDEKKRKKDGKKKKKEPRPRPPVPGGPPHPPAKIDSLREDR
jgi:hypothetical protein